VSTVAQNRRPFWTSAFTPPWFSPACHRSLRLAARYLPRSRPQGEPRRNVTPWASDSPTTLTCMRLCIRAWHPINGVPLPDASPIQPVAGQGEERMTCGHAFFSATSLPTALPCCETENLSILYTRSILHQKQRFVKRLGIVGMMLVSKPIGGTNVNLDISHGVVGMLAGYTGKRLCRMMVVCEA
jgi:hypothetical protein